MQKHSRLRLLTVLLILIAVVVTACGGGAAPTQAPAGQSTDQEQPAQEEPAQEEPGTDGGEGAANEEREPVTLTYWHAAPFPPLDSTTAELVEAFMEEYPWITVKVEGFSFGEYFQKIDTATAGGGAPDVFWVDMPVVPRYAFYETVLPLDDFLPEGYADDWFEGPWADATYDGKVWAIPLHQSTEQMLFNRDIVEAAGLEPPETYEQPWTLEEFREAVEATTQKGSGGTTDVWGFTTHYELSVYNFQPWIAAQGAAFMDPDRTTYLGYTNGEKTIAAAQWFADLHTEGFAAVERIPDIFQTGKVAFYQANPFVLQDIQNRYPDLNIGVTPMPCGETCAVPSGGWHIGIHASTQHPEEAWLLVDYLTNQEGHRKWIEGTNYMPARKSVYEAMPEMKEYPNSIFMTGLTEHAVQRPVTPGYQVFNDVMTSAIRDIILGVDIQGAFEEAAQRAEEELQNYK